MGLNDRGSNWLGNRCRQDSHGQHYPCVINLLSQNPAIIKKVYRAHLIPWSKCQLILSIGIEWEYDAQPSTEFRSWDSIRASCDLCRRDVTLAFKRAILKWEEPVSSTGSLLWLHDRAQAPKIVKLSAD